MEQSPKNVTVLDGKDATIVCRAVGAPQPNITWTRSWAHNGKCFIFTVFMSSNDDFQQMNKPNLYT